ncbi:hypothetical protein AWH62_03060 [Maricaulis sp. W15]|uniref:Uncharacterized protein n=1 Tax=Maricaulis maris TaxID=74318 RepID=A0A495D4E7_9PROT|nr:MULTISPECIES: hypothetical protein [Maricaulis]OLF77668.1 hypothetical protein AWH62_03060 [Maricaulis sp. W15]RKQ95659.1 hypothetical protein C7435_2765 [Maricaulis maris]
MSVFRIASLVVTAVSGGVFIGRKLLADQVRKKKKALVEQAGQEVRERMTSQARDFVIDHLSRFCLVSFVKAALLLIVVALGASGLLADWLHASLVFVLLGLFIVRDIIVSWPVLRFSVRELHKNRWRPRLTLAEVVAASTFDQVLAESAQQPRLWHDDLLLALAGESRDGMVEEIAREVARIASETSWPTLKPYFLTGAGMSLVLSLLYAGFAWLALHGLVI